MRIKSIALLLAAMLFFTAAGSEEFWPITATDDLGRPVNITSAPERIISLAPSNTEILFALGLGDNVVGVKEYCNYRPGVESLEKTERSLLLGGMLIRM